ncbi:FKBP-type peptidyl-prolyl cis-trans isomerase [Alteromonadaceae bacterium BrNp21-10]|nr:FKBP-type peptidyl-prolyl cis-trans isomerase [Alteromonadaceae bacterium BrNp21-10]
MKLKTVSLLALLLFSINTAAASFWDINKWLTQGQYDMAIEALSEQIRAGNSDTDNHFLLAIAYYQKYQALSENNEAIDASLLANIKAELDQNLTQVLKLEPNHGPAYYYRGLVQQIDYDRLKNTIDHDPALLNQITQSIIADFTHSIALTSEAQPIYQARADFYLKLQSFTKAQADLAKIREFENAHKSPLSDAEFKRLNVSYLKTNASHPSVVKTLSGLQFKQLKAGKGRKPLATDTVVVDYVGRLVDGSVFDSSIENGQPATFPLNQVIKGWTEALQLMNVGDEFEIVVPAELGYGQRGSQGIKPNSVLIFNIHLIAIK